MEPSPHVAALFKARNVGSAPASESIEEHNTRWLLKWDAESPTHSPGSQARAIAAIVPAEGYGPRSIDALRPFLEKIEGYILSLAGAQFDAKTAPGALRPVVAQANSGR